MQGWKLATALAATAATIAAPASAAAGPLDVHEPAEQQRAAFAGAVLRLGLDGRGMPAPSARLGIGFTRYDRSSGGAWIGRSGAALPLEAGLSGGRPELFVAGQRLAQIERRLDAAGSNTAALLVIGALAAGGAALVLLSDGDDDNPCPPGVEVCAF
jgi:hypothetical protein